MGAWLERLCCRVILAVTVLSPWAAWGQTTGSEAVPPAPGPPTVAVPVPVPEPEPVAEPVPVPEPGAVPEPPPLATDISLDGPPGEPVAGEPVPGAPPEAAVGEPAPRATEPADALDELAEAEAEREGLDERLTAGEEAVAALEDELAFREEAERVNEAGRLARIDSVAGAEGSLGRLEASLSVGTETGAVDSLDATVAELRGFEASARDSRREVEADAAGSAADALAFARDALARRDLFQARQAIAWARFLAAEARERARTAPSPPPAELSSPGP